MYIPSCSHFILGAGWSSRGKEEVVWVWYLSMNGNIPFNLYDKILLEVKCFAKVKRRKGREYNSYGCIIVTDEI